MHAKYIIKLGRWKEEIKHLDVDKNDLENTIFFLKAMDSVFKGQSSKAKRKINLDVTLSPIIWPTNEQLIKLRKKSPRDYRVEAGKWLTFDGKNNLEMTFYSNSQEGKLFKWEGEKAPPFLRPLLESRLKSKKDFPVLEQSEEELALNSFPSPLYYGSIGDCDATIDYEGSKIRWTAHGLYCMIFGSNFEKFSPIWNKLKRYFPKSELTQKGFLKSLNRKELRGYVERHGLEAKCRKGESLFDDKKFKTGAITVCIIPDSYKKKPTIEYFLSDSDIAESDFLNRKKDIKKTINFFKENAEFLLKPRDSNSNHYSLKYFHLDLINKKLSDNMKLALIEVEQNSLYAGAACGLAVQHVRNYNVDSLHETYNEMIEKDINNTTRKYKVKKTEFRKLYAELSQRKEVRER